MARKHARAWNQPTGRCRYCGGPIWQSPNLSGTQQFCSSECRGHHRATIQLQELDARRAELRERRERRKRQGAPAPGEPPPS